MISRVLSVLATCCYLISFGQTTDVETITFNSGWQGLFNPSTETNPYSINQGYSIPTAWTGSKPTFNQTFVFGPQLPSIPSINGCDIVPGAEDLFDFLGIPCPTTPSFSAGAGIFFDTKTSVEIDMDYVGFGQDSLRVEYPAEISVTYPDNNTYNAGEWVYLATDFALNTTTETPKLETVYPSTGDIEAWVDFDFEVDISVGVRLDAFGIIDIDATYPVMSGNIDDLLVDLVGMSDSRFPLYKISESGSFGWGSIDPASFPQQGWFPNLPGGGVGFPAFTECSTLQGLVPDYCQTAQFYDDELPLEPSTGPFNGEMDLPFVTTSMTASGNNLVAQGNDEYTSVLLSFPALAAMIIDRVECPCPSPKCAECEATQYALVQVLENLEGEINIPIGLSDPVSIEYSILSAGINLVLDNQLNVDFEPTIFGSYTFLTPVDFEIYPSNGGAMISGSGSEIMFTVGDSIRYKYPCFYNELIIEREYTMDGQVTSEIGDNFNLGFVMKAGGVKVDIPGFTIFPGASFSASIPYPWICSGEECILGVCVPYVYPCVEYKTISVDIPSIGFDGTELSTCSVYNLIPGANCDASTGALSVLDIPFGSVTYNQWHERTWSLEGFTPKTSMQTLSMAANQMSAIATATSVNCFGESTGQIDVSITNGTQNFTVDWSNSMTTGPVNSQNVSLSGVPAGNYVGTVIDANGCQFAVGATIEEPLEVLITAVTSDVECNGGSNGSIDLNLTGGAAGYSYNWTGTGNGIVVASEDQTTLSPGNFNVAVTDGNGCVTLANYSINEPAPITESNVALVNANCFASPTGSLDVTITGGNIPYSYEWLNGASNPIGNLSYINNLENDTYTLNITDGKGCTESFSHVINEPPAIVVSSVSSDALCFGDNTGSIDLTVNGGSTNIPGQYSYTWFDNQGAQTTLTMQDPTSVLEAGTYVVQVTDDNGCMETWTETVNEPNIIEITAPVLLDLNCFGVPTGAIDITSVGGDGNYSFNWSTSNGTGLTSTNEDQNGLSAGNYDVLVTDGNGCTSTNSFILNEPSAPIALSFTKVNVGCFGDATGAIDLTVTGGTAPYTFDWSNDGTGDFDDPEDLISIPEGIFDLTVIDNKGCQEVLSVTIGQPAQPLTLSETHNNVLCYGENTGVIDITTSGGTSPYSYQWSDSSSFIMQPTTEDLSNLYTGIYSVFVLDDNQCEAILQISVDQPAQPITLSSVTQNVDCYGDATGSIDLTITGGTGSYIFDWDNDGTGDNDDTEDLGGLVVGTYNLIAYDDNSCSETITVQVNQPLHPISPSIAIEEVKCNGDTTGAIDLTVFGGTQPYVFDWDNDGTGDNDDTEDLTNIPSALYSVTITDTNGCSQTTGGFVAEPINPLTIASTVTEPACFGYSNGSIELDITGGTTPYYMEWGNQQQILMNNPSELFSGLIKGEYFFRVTDKNDCIYEEYIFVDQPDTLEVDVDITEVSCFGGDDGAIYLTPSGGTLSYNYTWSNTSTSEDQVNLTSQEYSYVLTDSNGCIYKQTLFVDQAPEIQIGQEIVPLSCIDQTDAEIHIATVGGTKPYEWQWSNGNETEHNTDLIAGQYNVIITDDYNCQKSYDFIITPSLVECVQVVNSFTPNGDNYNDTWIIENLYLYPNAEVRVFNRWGSLLFESIGTYSPWDGVYKGQALPSEVYYYIIRLNNGIDNQYTGTVTIVR